MACNADPHEQQAAGLEDHDEPIGGDAAEAFDAPTATQAQAMSALLGENQDADAAGDEDDYDE